MSSSRHDRIYRLFLEVCELSPAELAAVLERECAGDPDLRTEVESLLLKDAEVSRLQATRRLAAPVEAVAEGMSEETLSAADATETLLEKVGRPSFTGPERIPGYTILRKLGSGGAGTVYEALQQQMNRRVALKVLHAMLEPSPNIARRFEQEAWIAGKLSHPNIVKVHERGSVEGLSYYSMELVTGGSFNDVIENMRRHGRDDRLGMKFRTREYNEWALRQVVFAARALDYTHRQGVIHRDVKPMNLLLDGEELCVKVADFGIAVDVDRTRITADDQMVGTLRYMAPEQLLGKRVELDGRTDVYALGVTLFELLTLDHPYQGATIERYINAVLTAPIRRASTLNESVSRDLEIVIGKALEKEPADRYGSAGELADDLENVLGFRPIRAQPPGTPTRVFKWVRRRPIHAALIATLAVGVPVLGLVGQRVVAQRALLRAAEVEALVEQIDELSVYGRHGEVVQAAERLLKLEPDNITGLSSLAAAKHNLWLALDVNEPDDPLLQKALRTVDRLIELKPESRWPLLRKASFLDGLEGRDGDAGELRRRAAALPAGDDLDELYYEALQMRTEAGRASGDERREKYREAERLLTRVIQEEHQQIPAMRYRGDVRFKREDYRSAIRDFSGVADLRPTELWSTMQLGRALMSLGDYEEADGYLESALEIEPDDPNTLAYLAANAVSHGVELRSRGKRQEAIERFRQGEDYARRSLDFVKQPMTYVTVGSSLLELYRTSEGTGIEVAHEAIEFYEVAKALAGGSDKSDWTEAEKLAVNNICDALIEIGELERALPSCLENIELDPNDVAFYNLAGVYALLGRREEALEALRKDLELGDCDFATLRTEPWFESLRDDPRFEKIVEEMVAAAMAGP